MEEAGLKGEETKQGCNFRPGPTVGNSSLLPPRTSGVKSTPQVYSNLRQGSWAFTVPHTAVPGWRPPGVGPKLLGTLDRAAPVAGGQALSKSHRFRPLATKAYKIEEETCRNGKGDPKESGGTAHSAVSTFLYSRKRHYFCKNNILFEKLHIETNIFQESYAVSHLFHRIMFSSLWQKALSRRQATLAVLKIFL